LELGLDAFDDLQRILSLAHHHDAADDFAFAIEIGNTAAHIGSERHTADIADADRHAVGAGHEGELFQVVCRLGIAAPTHHVFAASEFHQSSADVVVPGAHGGDDLGDGNSIRSQPVRIDVDLVLPHKTAERRYFGHSGDGLEVIAQVPILRTAQ